MFTIGYGVVSATDSDLVKLARKDYVNVKPVSPACACVAAKLQ